MKRRMAVAVAALAAGVILPATAAVLAPATAGARSPAGWKLVFQSNRSGFFYNIAAISGTNVWAVAGLLQRRSTIYEQYIRHFNGSAWRAVTIPRARMITYAVQATSASEVWVFGLTPNSKHLAASAAYRWDGRSWHKIPLPGYTYLQGTVVLGPSNVWAFGGSSYLPGDVFHWNGRRWAAYNPNVLPQDLSASSAHNIWLAGITWAGKKQEAAAYRWNGRRWRPVSMPHPVIDAGPKLAVLSRSNVWIAWYTTTTVDALHWNGYRWRVVTAPGNVDATTDIIPDGRGGYWFGPLADWTGHAWIKVQDVSPQPYDAAFGDIVRIPGTLSFLMDADVENAGSTIQHPTIYRLDLG